MSYYYLIASLPNISPTMDRSRIDFDETFEMIERNLQKADKKLFGYLIYPNDIQNLLSVLFREYHDMALRPFKTPTFFTFEEIEAYKFNQGNFPDFINEFLAENEDRFSSMSMRGMEDALMDKFYAEVFNSGNAFLNDYFSFERSLRSLIAAFHYHTKDFLSQPNALDNERFVGQIGSDRSPSASLSRDYPYLEELVKVMSDSKPQPIERFIERVLWDFLEERYDGFFSREKVLAYTLQLMMIQRWQVIASKTDEAYFDQLSDKIKNNVRSPKTPVI